MGDAMPVAWQWSNVLPPCSRACDGYRDRAWCVTTERAMWQRCRLRGAAEDVGGVKNKTKKK